MNPSDFGKCELSLALRSWFTENWIPPVTNARDMALVAGRVLRSSGTTNAKDVAFAEELLLDYVWWFNEEVCGAPASLCANATLSLGEDSASIPAENWAQKF